MHDLDSLEAKKPGLAGRVRVLINDLEKRKAQDGAKRLAVVAQKFSDFTVEGAYQYIKKDEIILELEERGVWWLSVLFIIRDALSIAPIAFTWLALNLAASAYQKDLNDPRYKEKDLYQPFLFLWQENFHSNHGNVIQFSWAAGWDAVLLALLIAMFVFIVPWARSFHRTRIYKSLDEVSFDKVINDLLVVIGTDGANTRLEDKDTHKIAEAIKQALRNVLLNYDRVALEARKYIQETEKQTKTLVEAFHQDLGLFNADVQLLTDSLGEMKTSLENHDQQVQKLADVSGCLADSSKELAESAKELVSSAKLNVTVCGHIENRLGELNLTQQAIVLTQQEVADTIKKSQEDIAKKLDTNQREIYQEIVNAQKEIVQEMKTTQQEVIQEIGNNEKRVYQEIVETQKEVVRQVTMAQQAMVQQITDSQEKVVQDITDKQEKLVLKITDSQDEVVDEIRGAADTVERSSKDTRDASLNLEKVADKLEQLTRTDFQTMTNGIEKSNQDLVKEVQKTVDKMTEATKKVEEFTTKLGQINQPAQALADAANQVSKAADSLPQFQQPLQDLSAATKSLENVVSSLILKKSVKKTPPSSPSPQAPGPNPSPQPSGLSPRPSPWERFVGWLKGS